MTQPAQSPNVLILGASGGIGSALARQLASLGYGLSLAARSSERLDTLAADLKSVASVVEATDSASVEACVARASEQLGPLHGVVNCVGSLLLKPAHSTTDEDWAGVLAVNLNSSFYVLRAAASRMMRSGGGSIVLLASAVAQRGLINHEAIAAAKAGVVGLAQSAAATYARYSIRVNCVAPGLTRTPLTESLTRHDASMKASAALHPLGRIGEPEEVASAIRWFLDPQQSWVTGQVLAVDGGLSSVQARAASFS
jgi:NAD(P)-dependent dehydrogenase (short-subunit alcohol dehydrogenase family)